MIKVTNGKKFTVMSYIFLGIALFAVLVSGDTVAGYAGLILATLEMTDGKANDS